MAKTNPRIVKKLSIKAEEYLSGVNVEYSEAGSICSEQGSLLVGTPIVRVTAIGSMKQTICLWALLREFFITERTAVVYRGREWIWGNKPTPDNVITWAYWEETALNKLITLMPEMQRTEITDND
ncbi:hypothetical protein [Photobacterium leiognathi]|uniref:hypothetical protein n=1 Tax=Photobacterium leiognathi TaxID=553611 RepID=UPI002981B155|nr:hypothetical protein [Photobacterium leiognathi]